MTYQKNMRITVKVKAFEHTAIASHDVMYDFFCKIVNFGPINTKYSGVLGHR